MNGTFHYAAERSLLRQTAAPKCEQMPVQLLSAEPDFDTIPGPLARLMRKGADEKYRTDLETLAKDLGNGALGPVFDVSQLAPETDPDSDDTDEERRQKLDEAVQYFDWRGMLVRSVPGFPSLVSLRRS